jgi:ankyrin
MRSDNGTTWKEHCLEESQNAVQHILNHSFDGEGIFFEFLIKVLVL